MERTTVIDDKLHWYKDAIIYELHIKAFFDGNGDGIGDFEGLLQKLDYLQELGVTAIWVLPFYPSPLRDDGYDIADYYSINPRYGTIEQFQQFLDEAHKRNLKVITELVVNHTSDQHPWFQRARRAPKGSPERDYYVWSDDPTKYKDVRIIFTDYEASNWSWDPVAQQYYWHRFFHHQPDLNFDNPLVQEEIIKVLDYWCTMGVDGFRLDAIPYLFEREGTNGENLPETHAFLKKLRAHIDERYPSVCFLAEANMWPEDSASYFGDGDECHMNYHFPVMPRMFMALQREDRYPITDIFDQTPEIPENCQWAIFLRNHDELTLEMVTDEERDYMYKVYAKDPKAKINLGIRHRLAPLMENDRRRIELMNSLLFSLPGTPVIYYGDEIGMGDNFYLGDRDGVRTPMQWSPDRNAGFSDTNPQRLYLPVILDPQYHYESVNVETQRANTSSLFWFMKRIINMRKKFKAFSRGNMNFIHVDNPKVLAFTRTYEDETLLIVTNLSKFAQPAEIELNDFKGYIPVEAFSRNKFPAIRDGVPYFFTLAPHSYQWFVLQKKGTETTSEVRHPHIALNDDSELLNSTVVEQLQNEILPQFIQRMDWFTGKDKNLYSTAIIARTSLPMGEKDVDVVLVEVGFESALPEYYQLPLVYCNYEEGRELSVNHPDAIVARISGGGRDGYLCDAVYTTDYQHQILAALGTGKRYMESGALVFSSVPEVQQFLTQDIELQSKVHTTSELHTAIIYNNRYFLKVYRRVDRGMHPDVEITRFLTTHAPNLTTKYAGSMVWHLGQTEFYLGMLEHLEENHGDGHRYMLERIANLIERILARDRSMLAAYPQLGTLSDPVGFDELPENIKEFLGTNASDVARNVGYGLGNIHKTLASSTEPSFVPEEFSLHYQRSLFSSMTSLVRETVQAIQKSTGLPADLQAEVEALAGQREELLERLRRIYSKKFDVAKIRIHGNLGLSHILLTGKDLVIHDFGGNPMRPYSERILKRSPLRDVATMIRSFYYVAYEGFLTSSHIPVEEQSSLLAFADFWTHYMSNFLLKAYITETTGSGFFPEEKAEFDILIQTFLLENALQWFNFEMAHRPERVIIPLRIIQSIMKKN
ncbi:maltose alpha-D-glucosyltransferase [Paracnuella aquatica]|uniref:maltose alpha-D-glucosyltransferase n=1 Tax=Paracnuella aquatica TaxID=2268757 RepID=UPI000DEFA459|nr:maltose alpha-D-glucosyltransferase [Paracnuella aquatica]RPD47341.1 maltose alpha-D-glucosyltransferase [Paracnuella aquatica]